MKAEWAEKHNESRRKKYDDDPEYKKRVNRQGRHSYRSRVGIAVDEENTALANIGNEESFGKLRSIIVNGEPVSAITFALRDIAQLVGNHYVVVHAWLKGAKFPRPNVLRTGYTEGQAGSCVYSLEQAKRLLAVIAEHKKEKLYLDQDDTATIAALAAAMEEPTT